MFLENHSPINLDQQSTQVPQPSVASFSLKPTKDIQVDDPSNVFSIELGEEEMSHFLS